MNRTDAQETFAPLITDNCIGFVHIDLRKFDLNKTKSFVIKLGENYLRDLSFDEKSFNATINEFNKEIDNIEQLIRPQIEQVTENLGIRELAMIVYDNLELKSPVVLAIPWKNKNDNDRNLLLSLLESIEMDMDYLQTVDFLLLNPQMRNQAIKLSENLVPSQNAPIYDALKEAGNDEIKIAFVITDQLRKNFKQGKKINPSIPKYFEILTTFFVFSMNKIDWISASVSLGRLTSDYSKRESFRFTIKTPNENDAVFLRTLFEGYIDNNSFFTQTDTDLPPYALKVPQVADEFWRGLLRSILPAVKGDRLVFSFENTDTSKISPSTFATYCGLGAALLLPAIQAAYDAGLNFKGREKQDIDNIKMIVLALHNYHDANSKLPPLYTVDAEGKPLHSWRTLILPYLMQTDQLYKKIRLNEPWDSEYNKQFHNVFIEEYFCPKIKNSVPNKNCNYAVIAEQPLKPKESSSLYDIRDGTSNTVSVVVVKKSFCWMDPLADITLEDFLKGINKKDSVVGVDGFSSGVNIGFWDDSIRFLKNDTPTELLKIIGTANDGEPYSGTDADTYLKFQQ
jgi:hypothetical protein